MSDTQAATNNTYIILPARSLRAGMHGWIIRAWLPAYRAWEPEEDTLRTVYRTRREAKAAMERFVEDDRALAEAAAAWREE